MIIWKNAPLLLLVSTLGPGGGNGNPLPVFFPGESPGERILEGYHPWGDKRAGHDIVTKQ